MTARNDPGLLGTIPFASGATIDSGLYTPRNGSTKITLLARPTQDGTIQPFLRTLQGDFDLIAAAAVVAGDLALVDLDYAFGGIGSVYLQFVNTDATAGSCTFAATDGGGR